MFPFKPPWAEWDEDDCGLPEDDEEDPFNDDVLSTLCEKFAGFGILKWFEWTPDTEGSPEFTKGGLFPDIFAADKASEETWDREEAFEEWVQGLDTGGLLLLEGGKLGGVEELAVVEPIVLCDAFAVAELDVLLRLLPVEAFTVESCNWISIIWSPRRMVRFNGAFPERKSTTYNKNKQWYNIYLNYLSKQTIFKN